MGNIQSYRKELGGEPFSLAQKRNLLTLVKTFIKYMYVKNLLLEHLLAHMELPSRGFQLPKAIFSIDEIEKILAQPLLFGKRVGKCV